MLSSAPTAAFHVTLKHRTKCKDWKILNPLKVRLSKTQARQAQAEVTAHAIKQQVCKIHLV